jgi:transposase
LRGKIPALKLALKGLVTDHHRFLLQAQLEKLEFLESLIVRYDAQIEKASAPFAKSMALLQGIPGIGEQAVEVIVAEIGADMTVFPTPSHLSSWAGLCAENNESAGKRRSGKTTKGNQWLRTMLIQAAWAAVHSKRTIFSVTYQRWAKRMSKKKALIAVGHKIIVIIWHLLKRETCTWNALRPPRRVEHANLQPAIFRGTDGHFDRRTSSTSRTSWSMPEMSSGFFPPQGDTRLRRPRTDTGLGS